jgi:hypothetical protein
MSSTSDPIVALLSKGEVVGGHRSRAQAEQLVPALKVVLKLPPGPDPRFDPPLVDFIIEVVLGAVWYEHRYGRAKLKVYAYIALNCALIIGLPLGLIGLGKLADGKSAVGQSAAITSQIVGVLTGILALQKTLATWYASQQRYAAWYKAATDLKSLYYGLVQAWAGKAAGSPVDFAAALATATAAGRKTIDDEQLDFYQKLAMPSFDVLDMLTSTRATVTTFVTSLLPGTPPTTVSTAGKNALTAPLPLPGGGAAGTLSLPSAGTASAGVVVRAAGAPKPADNPYTIVIIANPVLQQLTGSLIADPILATPTQYQSCVDYIVNCLFGRLPGQAESFLAPFEPQIRIVSIFDASRPIFAANALVQEFAQDLIAEPNWDRFAPLLAQYRVNGRPIRADVAFAVTGSATHNRSSAFYTHDDDAGAGVPFQLDGRTFVHRYNNVDPGVVALHVSSDSLVALHEFGHAASSWTNGSVKDLYVDSDMENGPINIRHGRPIPQNFATYNGRVFQSDLSRDGLNYPADWSSFHCALAAPTFPAVMDNFWQASGQSYGSCRHDQITSAFLTDRLRAIASRP